MFCSFLKAAKEDLKLLNLTLADVMNTWTRQMGHPLITIEKIDNNNIRIRQKQFLLDPSSPPTELSPYK
jgi:aminopeptidase N